MKEIVGPQLTNNLFHVYPPWGKYVVKKRRRKKKKEIRGKWYSMPLSLVSCVSLPRKTQLRNGRTFIGAMCARSPEHNVLLSGIQNETGPMGKINCDIQWIHLSTILPSGCSTFWFWHSRCYQIYEISTLCTFAICKNIYDIHGNIYTLNGWVLLYCLHYVIHDCNVR